ncbi:hypothetical protein Sme01_15670 [Sphaerisporangium melleum]|uniref:NACHT domain-containing protein n=1 Tax=Sphaerisporangium melleum TaxID=321316 RepID=A0A917RJ31_9ACTN|nr:trypsin-like peptidase domain-containing protein [Sphaerisporangium melleum]GGL10858.1 hypothetical protein GCM10007964_61370 [Sphaerisporangium melleum]GII69091.1 hypothetical protein Sme01_15670 [Sphaerisporangium melleum]
MRPWSVRVHGAGAACGAGVLIDDRHILTCAHVVNAALGRDTAERSLPAAPIEVDFPIDAGGARLPATVADGGWFPIEDDERGDVAVLRLATPPPAGTAPAVLSDHVARGTRIRAYGYPRGVDTGVWAVAYEVGDPSGPGWVQLDASRTTGKRIERGFSGAGVESDDTGHVLGIAVTEDRDEAAKVAWMLPVAVLARYWPSLPITATGHRPRPGDGTHTVDDARATPLPPQLSGVLRMMCQVTDDLPYPLRGIRGRFPLSDVYVRQSVAAAPEPRRRWDEDDDELVLEERRPATGLAQPFEQVFEQHDHLVIEGAAGLGKTTLGRMLTRHFAKSVLKDAETATKDAPLARLAPAGAARETPTTPNDTATTQNDAATLSTDARTAAGAVRRDDMLVPIMLPARVLATHLDRSWPEALRTAVAAEYGRPDGEVPADLFGHRIDGRRWLVVVDALDEIPDQDDRERLLTALAARIPDSEGPARFLVTTRPLSPGEVDRLRGPRVGMYELQPFDQEALVQFARNWFDPDGTPSGNAAAEEFLRQVRLAGLEEVLVVPLLATVAANIHQSRRDRPLPSGRYELYEEYIGRYAQARAEADSSTLAVLKEVTGGPALADWLYAHRAELLEELATAYTTTETPLLEVAQRFLADHAPLPARLPFDWESTLAEWLAQTGVLTRSRTRLRFLHHTFAEHLAATARAKTLPRDFRPGEPPWEELMTALLLDDEATERVVLHYLHLAGEGTGLLDALQHGTLDQRTRADKLIEAGAPTSEGQLSAYLVRLEDKVRTDASADLDRVSALTRHALVRERLEGFLTDPSLGTENRIAIIDALRERSERARRDGPSLLRSFTTADHPMSTRCAAATVLARFGDTHRAQAARILQEFAENVEAERDDRMAAARGLAGLGAEHRARAGLVFHRLATDSMIHPWYRIDATEDLAKCGAEHRTRAAAVLRNIAADATVGGWNRPEAVEKLYELGGPYREEAVRLLDRLAEDLVNDPVERAYALVALAKIEPCHRSAAAEAVVQAATDVSSYFGGRRLITVELAELGEPHRATAANILFALATRPDTPFPSSVRWHAAKALLNLGPGYRAIGADALHVLVQDARVSAGDLRNMAVLLARLGGDHRSLAADALLRLATGHVIPVETRHSAAKTLANLGSEHHRQVLEIFEALREHPLASSTEQALAATTLAALNPDTAPVAAGLLHRVAGAPTASTEARLQAAETLTDLGSRHIGQAADLYVAVAADHLHSEDRRTAADKLLSLGGEYRKHAVAISEELITDPTIDSSVRWFTSSGSVFSAEVTADRCAEVGDQIISDVSADFWYRVNVLNELRVMGAERSRLALALQYRLATDPSVPAMHRKDCLEDIAHIGEEHRARAVAILLGMAEATAPHVHLRPFILACVARIEPAQMDTIAELLHRHAADPLVASAGRGESAYELAKLGGTHRRRGAEILCRLATDLGIDANERMEAARSLTNLGGEELERGAELLYRPATRSSEEAVLEPDVRRRAALDLARLGGEHRIRGAAVLTDLAADPLVDVSVRWTAARDLAGLGGDERDQGARVLGELVTGSIHDPEERLEAALALAELGPTAQVRAFRVLGELAVDASADVFVRRWCAEYLGRLPVPETQKIAITALHRLAEDRDVDAWNRLWAIESLAALGPDARRLACEAMERFRKEKDGADGELPRALAIAAMADVSDACHFDAVELLTRLAESTTRADHERIQAAITLLRLSYIHTERGARLLGMIAADPGVRAWERRQAAETLARLGPGNRAHAVQCFQAIAADAAADPWERGEAAMAMAHLSTEDGDRQQAVAVLQRIAEDKGVPGDQRRHAAGILLVLGPEARPVGIRALQSMATDRQAGDDDRWSTLAVLTEQEEDRDVLARMLRDLAEEPDADAGVRRQAALALAMLGDERREEAVRALRGLSADPAVSGAHRALALDSLATITPTTSLRDEAAETLAREAADPANPVPLRRTAAEVLARHHLGHRGQAAELLHEIAAAESVHPEERRHAAQALADLGSGHRDGAIRLLQMLADDTTTDQYERAVTALALAALRPSHRRTAVDHARRLLNDPGLPADRRLTIAEGLAELGTPHQQAAVTAVQALVVASSDDGTSRFRAVQALARLLGADGRIKEPPSLRDAPA